MMTTTNTTTTNTTNDTNDTNDATAQPQPPHDEQPRGGRKPKWMRAPTPFEKQRGARLILEAAGRLRPRRRVVAVADGASVAEVEAAVAAVALVAEEEEEEEDEEREG